LSNFSKEFYHWLAVSGNEAQRFCVWLVALGLKIAKGDEPEENSENFPIDT
jgi:hypothetical protein